jgi:hypothetical protein
VAEECEREASRFSGTTARLLAGGDIDINKVERAFKDAALAEGNRAFLAFLSGLPESMPICPECGGTMLSQGKREKSVVSMLGEGWLARTYYKCGQCGIHTFPKDGILGISDTSFTPGVKRAVARLAASEPFESASQTLWELCGINICSKDTERIAEAIGESIEAKHSSMIEAAFSGHEDLAHTTKGNIPVLYIEYDGTGIPVVKAEVEGRAGKQEDGTAKTREMKLGCIFTQHDTSENGQPRRDKSSTSYFAAIEKAEDFGRRVYAEALRRGTLTAGRVVIIGDGAKWIWNIADLHFPDATQIVDLYHAKEHIWNLLKAIVSDEIERKRMKDRMCVLLDAGDIPALTAMISVLPANGAEKQALVRTEAAYFANNASRMDYAAFKRLGIFVGSGVIEAGCKNVIGKRLKQSGMHWSVRGANSIAALRCKILSKEFAGHLSVA